MLALDSLDQTAARVFTGFVVRKDLARKFQGLYPVPTYVGEFLLGRYCATTDEAEIQEGLEVVDRLMRERVVGAGEEELFKSRARENGSIRIIDLVTGRLDPASDSYVAELPSLRLNDASMPTGLALENERMFTGGFYAEIDLAYVPSPAGGRPFGVTGLKPIQLSSRRALEDMATGRAALSTEDWKALLLRSIGLEWSELTPRERDIWLLRLVPFVMRNYNMVEIGPRNTGKSHLFQQVSPNAHLVSGGKATVARMFIDNRTKIRGLVCQYDVICFDEIAGVSFDQKDGVNIMKGYMESGEFSRGSGNVKAEGSIVFNGNFPIDVETQLRQGHLFSPLPPDIRDDTAFMDRIHSYIPGWDIRKLEKRVFTEHFGLVSDFLAECWSLLRSQSRIPSIQGRYQLGEALNNKRDSRAVELTLDGLLKILYPDPEALIAEDDLVWALELALESRRRVKEQQRVIGRAEFGNTQFSFSAGDGVERFVETPEQRLVRREANSYEASPFIRSTEELIGEGESGSVEFKASFRYDISTKATNTELIRGPVKTVAAFMNTEGGVLIAGVTDQGQVIGIDKDLKTLKYATVDEYERYLRQALNDALGVEFGPRVRVSFPRVEGIEICRVDVAASPKPVFVTGKSSGTEFYIRSGPRSDPLDPQETHDYIKMHWE